MTEHDDRIAPPAAAHPADAPMFSRAAWVRILPFAAYLFFIVAGDVLERSASRPPCCVWLYPLKIAIVALLLALFWRQYAELAKTRPSAFLLPKR
jgi:hypothetical protein